MADEGFHEIQLNGKQLVFLFIAATVVSVVVFLLGVMVGRNVRQSPAQIAAAVPDVAVDPTADPEADPIGDARADLEGAQTASPASASDRTPLSAQESLTYTERLESPEPPVERFRVSPPPARVDPPAAATLPKPEPAPAVQLASFTEPAGSGWVVQVMAAVKREEAETLAQRLTAKGYPTFVSVGDGKVPARFRVRIGKYTTKREAEAVELKLQKQEQFKTWLTR